MNSFDDLNNLNGWNPVRGSNCLNGWNFVSSLNLEPGTHSPSSGQALNSASVLISAQRAAFQSVQ